MGRVFNLNNIQVAEHLDNLQKLGYIKVVRAAGLDIIKLQTQMTFIDCIERYYENLNN